ncbi:DinB family protein [Hymenobacter metallicola]|uniref:DinB family protein n=1 Tax=Hymenobacter metallicola TaxID=2563114 RepID=A0A4Z0QAK9_9BACT|nr:DinB family protein [Hymenobacter metallicola]TGE27107.1 DinB family protein [Hymenobacter metallicola]
MSEITRIHDQLCAAFDGEPWSGPSLLATLAHLTASQAAARPVAGAHSIWEIVLHLTSWLHTVRQRVESRRVVALSAAQDWPPQPTTLDQELWENTLQQLRAAHQQLISYLLSVPDAELHDSVREEPAGEPGTGYSVYVLLHGLAQHNLYHAGQIALLRKALGLPQPS